MRKIEKITELRKLLHHNPEPSMKEKMTKEILVSFIKQNSALTVVDKGAWFYAVKKGGTEQTPIAFRADFDAVVCADGKARHLCGHDGHSAILAGLAMCLENVKRDVYLIFQPGEETGEGGKICSELIGEKQISEIYAFHNIPGYEQNVIILPEKTFACASTGLKIELKGKIAHAAYPDQGINPATEIAELISYMDEIIKEEHKGIVLGTVIGIEAGSESYGVSAGSGELRLTLRAEYQDEFEKLVQNIEKKACGLAQRKGLNCRLTRIEEFPATINHTECVRKLKKTAESSDITVVIPEEPFRWSEDFGYYLQKTKGAMFGIGCGTDHAGLHMMDYEFNDQIIETAICIFRSLC